MEWITNVELAVIIGILLNVMFALAKSDDPNDTPIPPQPVEYTPVVQPKPQEQAVVVLKGQSVYARLRPDHPDLQEYRDTPGFFLVHPDGSVEPGVQ